MRGFRNKKLAYYKTHIPDVIKIKGAYYQVKRRNRNGEIVELYKPGFRRLFIIIGKSLYWRGVLIVARYVKKLRSIYVRSNEGKSPRP